MGLEGPVIILKNGSAKRLRLIARYSNSSLKQAGGYLAENRIDTVPFTNLSGPAQQNYVL